MIRIIDIRSLVLLAGLALFGAPNLVGCTQNVNDDTNTQDDEIRGGAEVDVSYSKGSATTRLGTVPASTAQPTTRLGPQPDPWQRDDEGTPKGPQPDPWSSRGSDGNNGTGTGTGGSTPKPGDPSNPNQ